MRLCGFPLFFSPPAGLGQWGGDGSEPDGVCEGQARLMTLLSRRVDQYPVLARGPDTAVRTAAPGDWG